MPAPTSRRVHLGLCALYLPLTVWATWPVAPHAATHVVDPVRTQGPFGIAILADLQLILWTLAWPAHALATAPLALLDGNIFHPARWSDVRSDHLLGNLPLSAPVYLVTDNPVLAHQAALLLTFVLSAVAAYVTVWRCVRRADAAFVAGALFGLSPSRFAPLAHIQTLSTMYLPLIVATGIAALERGGATRWATFAATLVLQALCAAHLAALGFVTAVATLVGWWAGPDGLGLARTWRYLAVVAGAAVIAAVPYLPSAWLQGAGDIQATGWVAQEMLAARPLGSFLPRPLHGGASPYFLTAPALLLGIVALLAPSGPGDRGVPASDIGRLRAVAVAVAVTGYVLSLGPTLRLPGGTDVPLPFRALALLPALRAPVRFGTLVALGAALLAGVGVAALGARLSGRWRVAVVVAALAGLTVELHHFSVPLRRVETGESVPPVYRRLAALGGTEPVLELPVGIDSLDLGAMELQSRYAYFSTYHWSPLLNGHGAYPPESFFFLMAIARRLPDPGALQDLVDLTGLRWIVLHGAARDPARSAGWAGAGGLAPADELGDDLLFRVLLAPRRDLRAKLAWPSKDATTLSGLAVELLPPGAFRGALRDLTVPPIERSGLTYQGWVTVENQSDTTWPGFRPRPEGLVHVGYRWTEGDGRPVDAAPRLSRIPTDLAPNESVRVPFAVAPPAHPGSYHLRVTLVQEHGAWFDRRGGPSVDTVVEVAP